MHRASTLVLTAALLLAIAALASLYEPGSASNLLATAGRPQDAGGSGMLVGSARVVDGDTIRIGAARIRLNAVDAPEKRQSCRIGMESWPCGRHAAEALRDLIGGRPVACAPRYKDRYGRDVATCSVGGTDLGAWLVSHGWALAYRHYGKQYVADENEARGAGLGVWQGQFVPPWDERRGRHDEVDADTYRAG
jgi:endonuclease YncB( thermonuclease family)